MTRSERIERGGGLPSPNEPSTRALRDWIARQLSGEPRDSGPLYDPGELSYESPPNWAPEGMKREADRQAARDSAAKAAEGAPEMDNYEQQDEQQDDNAAGEEFTDAEIEVWQQLSPEDQAVVEKMLSEDPEKGQRLLDELVGVAASEAETTDQGVPLTDLEQRAWDRAELSPEAVAQFDSLNASQQAEVLDQMVEALATTPPGVPLGGYQRPLTASSWGAEMEKVRQRIAAGGRHLGG